MADLLPPLRALQMFEAAARHLSMTAAAGELCVTPGAVSLQIRELEVRLGIALFVRQTRSLMLTPQGLDYFRALHTAFSLLRDASLRVSAARRRCPSAVRPLSPVSGCCQSWRNLNSGIPRLSCALTVPTR